MIIVTGAAGFIGSCLVTKLNEEGYHDLILVDDFSRNDREQNLRNKKYTEKVNRETFLENIEEYDSATAILHVGARTDTTEFDVSIFDKLNLNYTKKLWNFCAQKNIPLIYASSAATYGGGELGYNDDHAVVGQLKPLNPYGDSKNDFDKWALQQDNEPPFWAGLKFFNVFGPNEYHKGRMASVVFHAFHQISKTGEMKLFKSHHPDYKDGEQKRDFVYVKDVVDVILFLLHESPKSGLYNLGSGTARTFLDLVKATFSAMQKTPNISFIPTPEDIRDKYQYFTEANMKKLRIAGYQKPFTSLEDGVKEYVQNYLAEEKTY